MRVLRSVADRKEKGQVLVLVALGLLVLVGVVALAVDGGYVYRERRSMQNAADAGALAGAYEICHGDHESEAATRDAAEERAWDYAVDKNGANDAEILISSDMITVTVTVSETVPTFFARVLGFPQVDVRAEAAAICGRASSAGLVWPIGYPMNSWETMGCGDLVVLWAEKDPEKGLDSCGTEQNDLRCCRLYPIDLKTNSLALVYKDEDGNIREQLDIGKEDGPGICLPDPWPGTECAWLDFSLALAEGIVDPCDNPGGGADELRWRILGYNDKLTPPEDCQSLIDPPVCIAQDTGVRNDVWVEADERFGDIAGIPLYDPEESVGGSDPCELEEGGGASFYVEDLGCVRVKGIYGITTWNNSLDPKGSPAIRVIVGEIRCVEGEPDPACDTLLGNAQPYPIGPGGFGAVSLVQ